MHRLTLSLIAGIALGLLSVAAARAQEDCACDGNHAGSCGPSCRKGSSRMWGGYRGTCERPRRHGRNQCDEALCCEEECDLGCQTCGKASCTGCGSCESDCGDECEDACGDCCDECFDPC